MRLAVFGWGNDSRGDDGLGPALLARIGAADWAEATIIEDYQLQIEHALDLVDVDCALFIDAGKGTPAPFAFARLAPKRDATHSTHALSPEAVLDVYARVREETPPPAFALCVRGESFELGEGLSGAGVERLEAAWDFVKRLMAERSVEAWDKLASQSPPLARLPE